ncbi:MAG: TIGR00159 family protein [Candidatus Omnitrophica bacterium]|nr:TIGR00159 family protein [Candidatus Omnitrophota bacterium]
MMHLQMIFNHWDAIIEVCILWGVFYMVYLLLKGTVAEQVMNGLVIIIIVTMLTRELDLGIINWLLTRLLTISVLAFLVIFQPEIRRGLAKIGRLGFFLNEKETFDEIAKSANVLSKKKIGGLMAIERETGLRRYVESGVELDAIVTSEMINTIFNPKSPLHDGGIIISGQRIEAAACLFPLTQNPNIPKTLGTRHRAAIGLSEDTDAVVVVVSEETGTISIAVDGKITREIEAKDLVRFLTEVSKPKKNRNGVKEFVKNIIVPKEKIS